jgi:hypothetical protein
LRIVLSGSTKISEFVADSGVRVVGSGTITKASINAAGVYIEPKPASVTVKSGITATVAGEEVKGSTTTTTGGGGGGGSSSSSAVTTVATSADLQTAITNGSAIIINLAGSITGDTIVSRAVTINGLGNTVTGNVTVNVAGVSLQNMNITGNLTAGAGIGSGDLTLTNVTVGGTSTFNGGGSSSIHLVQELNFRVRLH